MEVALLQYVKVVVEWQVLRLSHCNIPSSFIYQNALWSGQGDLCDRQHSHTFLNCRQCKRVWYSMGIPPTSLVATVSRRTNLHRANYLLKRWSGDSEMQLAHHAKTLLISIKQTWWTAALLQLEDQPVSQLFSAQFSINRKSTNDMLDALNFFCYFKLCLRRMRCQPTTNRSWSCCMHTSMWRPIRWSCGWQHIAKPLRSVPGIVIEWLSGHSTAIKWEILFFIQQTGWDLCQPGFKVA